jgi:hypothetical protein
MSLSGQARWSGATDDYRDRDGAGTVHGGDRNPLDWLFITWDTAEEPVRTVLLEANPR